MNCSINCLTFVPQAFLSVFISLHVCSDLDPIKIQVDEDSVNIVKIQILVEFGRAFSLKKNIFFAIYYNIWPYSSILGFKHEHYTFYAMQLLS